MLWLFVQYAYIMDETVLQYIRGFPGRSVAALIKKEIKFSSFIRNSEELGATLQSHIWLAASSYMVKYLRISSRVRKPFLIYDFAPDPIWISLYMRKILFFFISV